LVEICVLDCENVSACLDEIFMALAYPFACLFVLGVILLFCDDHQFIGVRRGSRGQQENGDSAA